MRISPLTKIAGSFLMVLAVILSIATVDFELLENTSESLIFLHEMGSRASLLEVDPILGDRFTEKFHATDPPHPVGLPRRHARR